MSDLLI